MKKKKDKENKVFFNSRQALKNLNNWVTKNCENVGRNFAKEARKASKGERDDHIYGTATDKEIKSEMIAANMNGTVPIFSCSGIRNSFVSSLY